MRFNIIGAVRNNLIQLENRKIRIVMLCIIQSLIVTLYIVGTNAENCRFALNLIQVIIRNIVLRQKVHTDDPLHKRIRNLPHFKENKPQQIPGFFLIFIIMECLLQQFRRAAQIP